MEWDEIDEVELYNTMKIWGCSDWRFVYRIWKIGIVVDTWVWKCGVAVVFERIRFYLCFKLRGFGIDIARGKIGDGNLNARGLKLIEEWKFESNEDSGCSMWKWNVRSVNDHMWLKWSEMKLKWGNEWRYKRVW